MEETGGKLCEREDNFREMYAALGDREKQSKIREAHPKATHCDILSRKTPHGCKNFMNAPMDQPQNWAICPMNPYFFKDGLDKNQKLARVEIPEAWQGGRPVGESYELRDRREHQSALIDYAIEIYEAYRFDHSPSLSSLEYSVVSFMDRRDRLEEIKIQAKVAAMEIGKILSVMFGNKE